jgi:hypothetical protein
MSQVGNHEKEYSINDIKALHIDFKKKMAILFETAVKIFS